MDAQEMLRLLEEEMQLLDDALHEANERLGKKLGVLMVEELEPIYAYSSSLRTRIRCLDHGGEAYSMIEKEKLVNQWRDLYEQHPLTSNTRPPWL